MSHRFTIALLLSIFCITTPAWADYEAGTVAYKSGYHATTLREIRPLAERGEARAQFMLGFLYSEGKGVPQDHQQARQWYEKAAVQGSSGAQLNLGTLYWNGYWNGEGGPKDYQMALFWFRQAADQGESIAQMKLGMLHEHGPGVTQDYIEAHKWYNLSAARGEKQAAEFRDALAKQMTPAQIPEAQKLAGSGSR